MKNTNFRSSIHNTDDGFKIVLPLHRDKKAKRRATIWSSAFLPATLFVLAFVIAEGVTFERGAFALFWTLVGSIVFYNLVKLLFGKEIIITTGESIIIGTSFFGVYFKKEYQKKHIKDLITHIEDEFGYTGRNVNSYFAPTGLVFNHKGKNVYFGHGILQEEGYHLINRIIKINDNHSELSNMTN